MLLLLLLLFVISMYAKEHPRRGWDAGESKKNHAEEPQARRKSKIWPFLLYERFGGLGA